jgi:NitT/TauT family transport system substrate-binding protein/putative hydroxymethylpyrimidine transport system substrate-binding protein
MKADSIGQHSRTGYGDGPTMKRAALVFLVLVLAACGSSSPSSAPKSTPATIALDFTPNAVHAPLYMAGDALRIQKPGAGPDSLKLVSTGKVDLGVLDIHDLALARERGVDIVAVGVLVGKPLAALIAQPGVERPRDLAGKTVGVSGLPSDPAFLKAIVTDDGGDYTKVKQVTIGFNAVSRLLTKRVDAVPAFWNAEGVVLKARGLDAKEFRVEDYGAPPYPEVVLATARRTLDAKRPTIDAALAAIRDGVAATRKDPDAAVAKIAKAAETDDTGLVREQLDAVLPLFPDDLKAPADVLDAWADFDARIGLVKTRPDVAKAFDFGS